MVTKTVGRGWTKSNVSRRRRKRRINRRNLVRNQITLAKKVRKLETDSELKYHDTEVDVTSLVAVGTIVQVASVPMQTSEALPSSREGNEILLRSYNYKFIIQNVDTISHVVRMIVGVDKQANGNPAQFANLLSDAGTGVDAITSLTSMSYRERFKILEDKYIVLNPSIGFDGTALSGNNVLNVVTGYMKKRMRITYLSSASDSDPYTNNLFLMFITGNTDADKLLIAGHFRIRYTDS